jgi:NAD(P)H-hydrate epimerase
MNQYARAMVCKKNCHGGRSRTMTLPLSPFDSAQDDKPTIVILTGPSGNGDDALVCAKWLKLWSYEPVALLSRPVDKLKPVTVHQLNVWEKFGGVIKDDFPEQTDLVIDGLLGYSLKGNPRGRTAELIEWTNTQNCPVLALDVPSGLDTTSGEAKNPCIKANIIILFELMKQGLLAPKAQQFVGELRLVDIGFPKAFPAEILQ